GKRWPPVPPAAIRTVPAKAVASSRARADRLRDIEAPPDGAWLRPAPAEGEQEPHAEGDRDHRRAAVGNKGQRHALLRHEAEIHRHVDDRLHTEEHDEPGRGETPERV